MPISDTTKNLLLASALAAMVITPALTENSFASDFGAMRLPAPVILAAYDPNTAALQAPVPSAPDQQLQEQAVLSGDHIATQNGISYVSGGIGDSERELMEAMKHDYNLHIISSSRAGEYEGSTHLSILAKGGDEVLATDSGPLFYAKLPAGTYTVQASLNGQQESRRITVGNRKPASLDFRW